MPYVCSALRNRLSERQPVIEQNSEQGPEFDALQWRVRWHDYVPAAGLVIVMTFIWLTHTPSEMSSWGVSASALSRGSYETILLHMFGHGAISTS